MKPKITLIILLIALLPLTACANDATAPVVAPPEPPASETPSGSEILNDVSTATTGVPLIDTEAIEALVPQGTPAEEWNGIPIMPWATAGEEKESGYVFSISATAEDIQQYYIVTLGELGFTMLAVGHGQQEGAILLLFSKDSQMLALSIIPYDTLNLVLIVREN